jgi:RsiW-degrading membrane proteinase PrsW (M82 family)
MNVWILFSGILAPAFFWIGYFYYQDRFQPEPLKIIGTAYLLGLAAAFACLKFYGLLEVLGIPYDPSIMILSSKVRFLLYSITITGLVEELFKFIPFLLIILFLKTLDEKTDGIIYASTVALGFASFENIGYLPYMEGFELFGRAFASPLTHTIFSSLWGYSVGMARLRGTSVVKASFQGIAVAALCHGVFNFLTMDTYLRIVSSILILIIWIWRIRLLEESIPKKTLIDVR